jgi:hypothetical protein
VGVLRLGWCQLAVSDQLDRATLSGPSRVVGSVSGQSQEPGYEAIGIAKGVQFAVDTEKDLLGDVLGECRVTEEVDQVTPHRALHGADETLECSGVAGGCCHDIRGIWSVHVVAPCVLVLIFIQGRP